MSKLIAKIIYKIVREYRLLDRKVQSAGGSFDLAPDYDYYPENKSRPFGFTK